jgi:hypothetical protein
VNPDRKRLSDRHYGTKLRVFKDYGGMHVKRAKKLEGLYLKFSLKIKNKNKKYGSNLRI